MEYELVWPSVEHDRRVFPLCLENGVEKLVVKSRKLGRPFRQRESRVVVFEGHKLLDIPQLFSLGKDRKDAEIILADALGVEDD